MQSDTAKKKKNPLNFKLQIQLYTLGWSEISTNINCTGEKFRFTVTYLRITFGLLGDPQRTKQHRKNKVRKSECSEDSQIQGSKMHGPHYSTQKQTRAFSFLRKKQRVTEIVQKKNAFFLS